MKTRLELAEMLKSSFNEPDMESVDTIWYVISELEKGE